MAPQHSALHGSQLFTAAPGHVLHGEGRKNLGMTKPRDVQWRLSGGSAMHAVAVDSELMMCTAMHQVWYDVPL